MVTLPGEKHNPKVYIPCLKCEKMFRSWDRILNRICVSCTGVNKNIDKTLDHSKPVLRRTK